MTAPRDMTGREAHAAERHAHAGRCPPAAGRRTLPGDTHHRETCAAVPIPASRAARMTHPAASVALLTLHGFSLCKGVRLRYPQVASNRCQTV